MFTSCFVHGRWFSPGTPPSSTTKTGRHDIAEILLKVELSTKYKKNQSIPSIIFSVLQVEFKTNITQFDMICLVFETKIRQHKYATWQWETWKKRGVILKYLKINWSRDLFNTVVKERRPSQHPGYLKAVFLKQTRIIIVSIYKYTVYIMFWIMMLYDCYCY